MAYRVAQVSVTLNDLEGHSPVAGLFKCNLSNICAAFYQIHLTACSRGPSAAARLIVCHLFGLLSKFFNLLLPIAWFFATVLSAGCVLYLRKSAVFLFPALILTAAQNFLATIWPLIEILRSLVPPHLIRPGLECNVSALYCETGNAKIASFHHKCCLVLPTDTCTQGSKQWNLPKSDALIHFFSD